MNFFFSAIKNYSLFYDQQKQYLKFPNPVHADVENFIPLNKLCNYSVWHGLASGYDPVDDMIWYD